MRRVLVWMSGVFALGAITFTNTGCSCYSGGKTTAAAAPATAPEPAAVQQPAAPQQGYGPSSYTFEQNGVQYIRGTMGYPTGLQGHNGLLLEKTVPAEVMVGQPFEYQYRVINQTKYPIAHVVVRDQVSQNFKASDADPQPVRVENGIAEWRFDRLEPGETVVIKVRGQSDEEGVVTTCGWASYDPLLCEQVKVLKAALQLSKTAPEEVLICDKIPMTLTVKNTGSSVLTGVQVVDTLPAGLTAENGNQTVTYDIGTLQPGESREVTLVAHAGQPGEYVNKAKVTTAQGVEAEASAKTVVRQPVLQLSCETPKMRYAGRPTEVKLTVCNKGDAPAANTVVTLPVPAGVQVAAASANAQVGTGQVVWNLGTLAPDECKTVQANRVQAQPGTLQVTATATGTCAGQVSTACQTEIAGIPAILLEVVDLEDPIEVGKNVTYEIRITNQGSAPATNVRITCQLEEAQQFVSVSGIQIAQRQDRTIVMEPIPSIEPKQTYTFRVTVKALKAANVRFHVRMISDQLKRPVEETESTNQY